MRKHNITENTKKYYGNKKAEFISLIDKLSKHPHKREKTEEEY